MTHQTSLDLGWANAIAARNNDIVVAAMKPEITFFIAVSGVAGQEPSVAEFLYCGIGLFQ
jgi:hypothetical protein